jgi:hypothetical protein
MKKYIFDIHYDMVIRGIEVMADNEQEAAQLAKDKAARLPMEAAECVEQTVWPSGNPQELSDRELRRMENEKVREFVGEYVEQQTPTEVHDIAEGYGVNWLEWTGDDETAFYNDLFRAISSCEHPRTAIFERYARMYARHRWQEVAREQAREWDEAFQKAKADPEGTRVIVETNEREEETGDGDRYFMIDKSDGCGNEYDRWQVIRCDCAASPYDTRTAKAYTVGTQAQPSCEASPNNVTRWAERMINAGRVVSIYADCY